MRIVYLSSHDELRPIEGKLRVFDLGHGRRAAVTCWPPDAEPVNDNRRNFEYLKNKNGFVRSSDGGYLVLL